MIDLNDLLQLAPFSLPKHEKRALHFDALNDLTLHHYDNCQQYQMILDTLRYNPQIKTNIYDLPAIPVPLFKAFKLASVEHSNIIKTLTSSGTTNQGVSSIFLDRQTSTNQTKVLAKIVSSVIGSKRLPMLIVDQPSIIKNRALFSARGAGIIGFSMFGYDVTFALDEKMRLAVDRVEEFGRKHRGKPILVFGFTSIIWQHFVESLIKLDRTLNLQDGVLIHGGGWKKLEKIAVDNNMFKRSVERACGIRQVHNYYGMVEQAGSIFMECEVGYFHSSNFSDIATRTADFEINGDPGQGLMQLYSLLPRSYPGHILLSEDIGEIFGEDDCSCGRLGKYFKIYGRATGAEIRGCSDVHT